MHLGFGKFIAAACLIGAGLFCQGETDLLIRDGQPDRQKLAFDAKQWRSADAQLSGAGVGNELSSRYAYRPEKFTVTATLALKKLDQTAAGISAGEALFGFDGTDRKLFAEPQLGNTQFLGDAAPFITPGKMFSLKLVGENGTMTLFLDGKEAGRCTYNMETPLAFTLRPHRNAMQVKDLAVDGTRACLASALLPTPVYAGLLDIGCDATLELPDGAWLPAGRVPATLTPVGETEKAIPFQLELMESGRCALPAILLADGWNASALPFNARPFRLELTPPDGEPYQCLLVLADPAAATDFPLGEVREIHGDNGFFLNGEPVGRITGRLSWESHRFLPAPVRQFGEAGIHGNILLMRPFRYMQGSRFDVAAFLGEVEEAAARMTAEDPDARLIIQFPLFTPADWNRAHPDQLIGLDNGLKTLHNSPDKQLQPSYASEAWRETMGSVVAEAVKSLRTSPVADRVMSFRLLYANCGEWNHWGYHENAFVDYSFPMQRAFGKYLRQKYGTVEALRRAWGRNDVDFDSNDLVPSRENRLTGTACFRLGGAQTQPSVDYYGFFQGFAADTIAYFAKIVKTASDRRLLTGAYYGYYYGHYGANPYHFQDSGNYGVGRILTSPDIDYLGGPYPYENRRLYLTINGIADSITLHGKVWESEGDQRTQYSGENNRQYGTTDDRDESIAIAKRDFMVNAEARSSYYFYDFIQNWYRDPEFMATVKRLHEIDDGLRATRRDKGAQIAVLFSEEVIPFLGSKNAAELTLFRNGVLAQMPFWGVPVDRFLASDIDRIDFSHYRMVIFADTYAVDDSFIETVRNKVAKDNRTLVFLYAPGVVAPDNTLDPERARQLTGIGIAATPEASISGIKAAWSECKNTPFTFKTAIDDASADVLATLSDGAPGMAERRFPDHKSIVICHPMPDALFMRGLFMREKLAIWSSGKSGLDATFFAAPLYAVYSRNGGAKTVWLPESAEVAADLFTGEILAENSKEVNFELPKGPHTAILYCGSRADYEKYFIPAKDAAQR